MPSESDVAAQVHHLCRAYGRQKKMGHHKRRTGRPKFFLHRVFLGEHDLLVILDAGPCTYRCSFCGLPRASRRSAPSCEQTESQFLNVMRQMRNSLDVLDRLTLSCDSSMLDPAAFSQEGLQSLVKAAGRIRHLKRLVVETRLIFATDEVLCRIRELAPRLSLNILTGFETLDGTIRDRILNKGERVEDFLKGLDRLAAHGCELTAYVLFKPSPYMSDEEAMNEARASADFLVSECSARGIPLTLRINAMYAAIGTEWADMARHADGYQPPRLQDVIDLAGSLRSRGVAVYIGASSEGLGEDWGRHETREGYSVRLADYVNRFNESVEPVPLSRQ